MSKALVLGVLVLSGMASPALTATCPAHPFMLTNGATADATQVMANFNNLLTCANTSLAPLASPSFTGTVGIGTTSPALSLDIIGSAGLPASSGTTQNGALRLEATANNTLDFGVTNVPPYGAWLQVTDRTSLSFYYPLLLQPNGGLVGINNTSPATLLEIGSSVANGLAVLTFGKTANSTETNLPTISEVSALSSGVGNDLSISAQSTSGGLLFGTGNGGTTRMVISAAGQVGIGTTAPAQALHVIGTIRQTRCTTAGTLSANTSGDIICTSDGRLKNILSDYPGGLDALLHITPKLFTYKTSSSDPVERFVHAGFIAQNVMAVIPQASARQLDGYYSLDTTAILAAAVNAIKQLKSTNDEQSTRIVRQADEISILKSHLSKFDKRIEALEGRFHAQGAANEMRRIARNTSP